MATVRSKWLRRAELTLWLIGVSLLGVTFATAVERKIYQAQQERVVERMMAAAQVTPPAINAPAAPPPNSAPESADELTSIPPVESRQSKGGTSDASAEPKPPLPTSEKGDDSDGIKSLVDETPAPSSGSITAAESLLGVIEIPRIGLSAAVARGEDANTLDRAVGWLTDTALPGSGGNAAFAAHRDTLFRPLENVRIGDTIRVTVPPHTYTYRVDSLDIVEPTDVSVLADREVDELTLITCHPFRYIGPAPNRFIVKATRIN